MPRTVFCKKYQQELDGLDLPPLPGARGQEIFETVSKKAWEEWLQLQTMLINEKQLNTMNMTDRTYLSEQMNKFFSNQAHDRAEGYVPLEKEN